MMIESRLWNKFLPDSMTTGVSRYAGDLLNSASGGQFESFILHVGKLTSTRLEAIRKEH